MGIPQLKQLEKVTLRLKDLQDSPYRLFLGDPDKDKDRIQGIADSIKVWSDFWNDLRARQTGNNYQLCFGHRRVRAAIQAFGGDYQVSVQCGFYTDAEMIRFLGDNGFRDTPQSERVGLVRLVAALLKEYPEAGKNPEALIKVDADLLYELVQMDKPIEGQERISNFLIPRLWPRDSIKHLNVWGNSDKGDVSRSRNNIQTIPVTIKQKDEPIKRELPKPSVQAETAKSQETSTPPDSRLQKLQADLEAERAKVLDLKRLVVIVLQGEENLRYLPDEATILYKRLME